MLSKLINIALVVAVLAYIANYFYRLPKYDDGEKAPDFSAVLKDGTPFDLASMRGDYVLVDFWGSWCPPCRKENPEIVQLYNTHKSNVFDKKSRFHIVSIGIETNVDQWHKAIQDDRLDWKHHIVQEERFNSPIALQYGVRKIPTKYLINPVGNIVLVNATPSEIDAYMTKRLRR